jgi:hypothetical protein
MPPAVSRHTSWRYFNPRGRERAAAGDYVNGFQLVPVNWRMKRPQMPVL